MLKGEGIDPAMLTRPSSVAEILNQYNIRPSYRLGQNFLVDKNVLNRIIESAQLTKEDRVLEIGPGIGTLTAALAGRAGRVYAIEMDRSLKSVLEHTLACFDNVKLIIGDALQLDFEEIFALDGGGYRGWKVVSNLPYYITSPFLLKILEHHRHLSRMVLMVQWEVANRLTAMPGTKDYGATSVLVQYHADVRIIQKVSARSFFPPPDVESAIVLLEIRKDPLVPVSDMLLFKKVVNLAFGQRRKTLCNALATLIGKEGIRKTLGEIGISPSRRGETLSIQEFAQITNAVAMLLG